MCVLRMMWGEKEADFGRGRGPWIVQVSFREARWRGRAVVVVGESSR